jgi:VPDSG-CTERM motif
MKKTFIALIATVLITANAGAILYVDSNTYLNLEVRPETLVKKEFNIKEWGFNPLTQQVYDATASFLLTDLWGGSETVKISLGEGSPVYWTDPILNTMPVGDSALWDLSADGILSFTITSTIGQTYLTNATIIASAGARSVSVPDGGFTLTLLGLSFLGILVAQRKFASAT